MKMETTLYIGKVVSKDEDEVRSQGNGRVINGTGWRLQEINQEVDQVD